MSRPPQFLTDEGYQFFLWIVALSVVGVWAQTPLLGYDEKTKEIELL